MLGISDAAEKLHFRTLGARVTPEQLKTAELPCILYWRQNHFVVLYKIRKRKFCIADPARGLVTLPEPVFYRNWLAERGITDGVALFLAPTPHFYDQEDEEERRVSWSFMFKYLIAYRGLFIQLLLGLGVGTLLQLITPFLAQSVVDIGISTRNISFIFLILIGQIALVIGRVTVEFIRSWILLHITTRINISILTDFLVKLMKLPISYFDSKMTGDIMQRMNDQKSIQNFLTSTALTTLFSIINLAVFSVILAYYNMLIFLVFVGASTLYVTWIILFLRRRRVLNYKNFEYAARGQGNVVQLIGGMQEIKLNNCEQQMRWEWEHIQARLFKYNLRTLALTQYQQGGCTLINEGKNVVITFLSAAAVVHGNLTLGAMVAIQYIVGQLNSPIDQLLSFIQGYQDAKISLERLDEIHRLEDEEPVNKTWIQALPEKRSIFINNLSFRYPGAGNDMVLDNISLSIPQGKTTAIVGMSGSGKTTLLKLLLRFYTPQKGEIKVGDQFVSNIHFKTWRSHCGVVMQDGYIFSDTIERNISLGDPYPDNGKLEHAIRVANIRDFIDSLPFGLRTKIGPEGSGISQGQRQRILIARAVYKNPHYILFDEATNALDANNERVIMDNLSEFFIGRTVIIVAHRLSTVNNADNIIYLDKGQVAEEGTHQKLTSIKGAYYRLVKNQLELGN